MDFAKSQLANIAKNALYKPSNQEYGSAWAIDGVRPERGLNAAGSKLPPYAEVVDSLTEFRRAQKLIKNRLVAA